LQDKEHNLTAQPPAWALRSLFRARVGHLACSTRDGKPLLIPICFAFDGSMVYSSIDEKPKRVRPLALRRVSNIIENPNVCFIVDEYAEDWRKLQYVLIVGHAAVIKQGKKFTEAIALLRKKYKQYNSMKLENRPLIKIKPFRIIAWKPTRLSRTVKPKEYD
jgi:PPOX class probable F420-dependent enzyme